MNRKHFAAIVVGLLAVLLLQVVVEMRKRLASVQTEVAEAQATVSATELLLNTERNAMRDIRENSASMLAFLDAWTPPLGAIDTPESGELHVASRVKEANLITLAQRFEVAAVQGNDAIPRTIRAHLTFEDDYAKTMNWLGNIEETMPSSRVTDLRVARGEGGNDIRVSLVIDVPLLKEEAQAAK
ncbi:MAG: hypothetical protein WA771_14555 [Chthoniobacterales bacterium]